MPKPSLFIVDTTDLRKALDKAEQDVKANLAAANRAAAEVVVARALPRVPVRSGRLRASVKALGSQSRGEAKAGGRKVPYAATVHFGRKRGNVGRPPGNHKGNNRVKGRPFLTDAAVASQDDVRRVYERMIDDIVKDI